VLILALISAAPWSRYEACDVPAADLAHQTTPSADACEAACAARPECAGFTFISGWGRCNLESDASRRVTVHLWAAHVDTVDGARVAQPPARDTDDNGKDLPGGPWSAADPAACASLCVGRLECVGYVFVEGYATCWLKATQGAHTPKQFTCGARAD